MDAQYPFASREDIWRVFEEVKDLYSTQLEHGERIARLERRREDDARLKSVWGPVSQFPNTMSGPLPGLEPSYTPTVDAFKGFDQTHHHSTIPTMPLDNEEEPRRGASRANSVRFDESTINGYYGQVNRSTSELPLRTGSGMSSHALTERSLSHRSDGRQSSSGHSHHSARTNSMGIDSARIVSGASGESPASSIMPPPGLYLLGPVPCIIRCWLTTTFSNDSLLYAAVCSGSFTSSLGYSLIEKLGYVDQIVVDEGQRHIKLPLYLPEASIHQTSSRAGSPTPQLPAVTVRFAVRDTSAEDKSIQIILGSDVLRAHNADILFSQDKIIMVDDERNKVCVPLVRPENPAVFNLLNTASDTWREADTKSHHVVQRSEAQENENSHETIERPVSRRSEETASVVGLGASKTDDSGHRENVESRPTTRDGGRSESETQEPKESRVSIDQDVPVGTPTKTDQAGPWGSWRRPDGSAIGMSKSQRGRAMKVLRPSRSVSSRSQPNHSSAAQAELSSMSSSTVVPFHVDENTPAPRVTEPDLVHPTPSRTASLKSSGDGSWPVNGKTRASNPIGGASAFGWLNSS